MSTELPISKKDLLNDHKQLTIRLRTIEKLSVAKITERLAEELERTVTVGVVYSALKELGLNEAVHDPRRSRVDVKDTTEDAEEMPIEELIDHRVRASKIKMSKHRRHNRSLDLPAEPIAFLVMGDPHIDNDGCDFAKLLEDIHLTQQQEGVMTACVGDMQDNWIGRLQRMYAESTIKASDGWRLSRWLLESMQWVAIVGGNHDKWAHASGTDPLGWIAKECGVLCFANDELRITLNWRGRPDLEPVVWIIRHDFKGRSWFHPTHGPHKEAMLDGRCHILCAGHIHQWGQLTTEQRHDRITNSIRVRGYKRADDYAMEKGFFEQSYGESCLIVINPEAEGTGRITIYWDLKQGYEILKFLRDEHKKNN